jgi:coenzyme F420-0:L-glutamate ligase/coenzyme F420-1:gamma-L-glutamate ligase
MLEILAVQGIPEVGVGDDLASLIVQHAPALLDGDVLVVTSKIVSKAEGQRFDIDREAAIDAETVRVVARRGDTRIVQTRHGFVMAAAGVDASNVTKGEVLLLPVDPDASARRIRDGVRSLTGVNVGVVISDTFGRPWRVGVTDVAVGFAGLAAFDDLRGTVDPYGNELQVTLTCTVDEIASAADLVKGKLNGLPVAILRGLWVVHDAETGDTEPAANQGIAALVRPIEEDMFSLGTRDVLRARVDTMEFAAEPVDRDRITRALQAAAHAFRPVGWDLLRFTVLAAGDVPPLLTTGVEVPPTATTVIIPHLLAPPSAQDLLAAGAAIENVLVALAIEQVGSSWVGLPTDMDARSVADAPAFEAQEIWPIGLIAIGSL